MDSSNSIERLNTALVGKTTRRQAFRLLGGGIIGGLAGGVALSTGLKGATAQPATGVLSFPVNFVSALGSFVGSFNVTQFAVQQGQLVAIGTLTGDVRNAAGDLVGTVNQALTLPVLLDDLTTTGTCDILHLELGPLDLDLLGLVVHLDKVVLDITAEQGPGNLLGNLLCTIAGVLDGNGNALGRLRNLLNQLLGLLG
jgi:hypothetical protein